MRNHAVVNARTNVLFPEDRVWSPTFGYDPRIIELSPPLPPERSFGVEAASSSNAILLDVLNLVRRRTRNRMGRLLQPIAAALSPSGERVFTARAAPSSAHAGTIGATHTGTTGAGPRRSALITLPSSLSVPCTSSGGGTELQKLDEYCDARGFTRSELMRVFVQNILDAKAPAEDANAG